MVRVKRILLVVFLLFISLFTVEKVFASSNIIKLTNIIVDQESSGASGQITDYTSNDVETNNIYHEVNNYIDYKLTIKNLDSKPYSIKSIWDDNNNPNIYYEYFDYKDKIIKPSQEVVIRIRETYNTEISDLNDRSFNNSVKFYFNLVDEDGVEIYTEGDNPSTGDKIITYIWIGGISLTFILIILIAKFIKSKKKKINISDKNKISIIILLMLLVVPFVAKANAEIEATITFNNNTTLYDKVEVTFNYNGLQKRQIVKYNSLVTAPSISDRTGYLFDGWYYGNRRYDFSNRVTSDIVLNAHYTKDTYTITYDLDGASSINPSTYNVSELPLTLDNPTKLGYRFVGWTGSNGDVPEKDLVIMNVADDLVYTANFEPIIYDITYTGLTIEEINQLNNTDEYTIEDTVTLNNPSMRLDKDGDPSQKFIGWKDDRNNVSSLISFSNSTNDKSFEAVWLDIDPTIYSISYVLNNGTVEGNNPISFTKNTESFTLINPTKIGYNFIGWTGTGLTEPTMSVTVEKGTKQDLEFIANYEPITYTITYVDALGVVNPTTYNIESNPITLNNPTKLGYNFIGWTGTDLGTETLLVTIPTGSIGNRTYAANYSLQTYNITYLLHDGVVSTVNPDTYNITDTFTLNNPTKEGAIFIGWTGSNGTEPEETVTITNSTGPLTFEANYEPAPYYIHFDKNDADAVGTMEDEPMRVGTASALTKNTFSKLGYKFENWTTNPDGTGTAYADEAVVQDLATTGTVNLYAKWKQLKTSQLISGSDFNSRMKILSHNSGSSTSSANYSIKKVKFSRDVPSEIIGDGAYRISVSAQSDVATYMWWDENESTIYYGGEADVIYAPQNASFMFANLMGVLEIDNNFDTSKTTKMEQMYYRCRKLEINNGLSTFNTSNVTTMKNMFGECQSMPGYDIKSWNVDNVQVFEFMFNQNYLVTSLDLTGWTVKNAINLKNMFSSMYDLTELKIGTFDTTNCTTMANMFDNEQSMVSLDLSHFNTEKVTNMTKMFYNMYALQSLNLSSFNTSKVTSMEKMFIGTNTIQTLDLSTFDTSKVTNFKNMFDDMTAIQTIYVSDSFVTTGSSSIPQLFSGDINLVGGSGTAYSSSHIKLDYAHIDGGTSNPGYFTRK